MQAGRQAVIPPILTHGALVTGHTEPLERAAWLIRLLSATEMWGRALPLRRQQAAVCVHAHARRQQVGQIVQTRRRLGRAALLADIRRRGLVWRRTYVPQTTHDVHSPRQTLPPLQSPVEETEGGTATDRLRHAWLQLLPAQRAALALAYFDGLTHHEIAHHLDLALPTVDDLLRSSLQRLRQAGR